MYPRRVVETKVLVKELTPQGSDLTPKVRWHSHTLSRELTQIPLDLITRIKYVSRYEIDVHEVAMQQMVKDEKREREAIDEKKGKSIKNVNQKMKKAIKEAEDKLRQAIEAAQKAAHEAIDAAKEKTDRAVESAENEAERKLKKSDEKLLAMQRD
jgi:hypothetical protein